MPDWLAYAGLFMVLYYSWVFIVFTSRVIGDAVVDVVHLIVNGNYNPWDWLVTFFKSIYNTERTA